jgi:release factor glutamine methyltransferase
MRRGLKTLTNLTWRPLVKWYLKSPRDFFYRQVSVHVPPGVFHPGFFFSTKQLFDYLSNTALDRKKVIEIGCGTGILSILAAKKGALVTCTDISPLAVSAAIENARRNRVDIVVLRADMFGSIPSHPFDFIIVNPPFYPRQPRTMEEHAWYAGPQLEYFYALFRDAKNYLDPEGKLLMVLSDDCDTERIKRIAKAEGWLFSLEAVHKKFIETGFIFGFSRPETVS